MSKGTPSKGKQSGKKTHIACRRCGGHSYHIRHKECSSCGFGNSTTLRKYAWQNKHKNGKRK